jgi:preprotein translocase subunit SecD
LVTLNKEIQTAKEAIAIFFEPATLAGKNIIDASAQQPYDGVSNGVVLVKFDDRGSKKFAKLTRELARTGLSLGIFLNNRLISDPGVEEYYAQRGITGGSAQITIDGCYKTGNNQSSGCYSCSLERGG